MPNSRTQKERKCTKCSKTKPLSGFYFNKRLDNHYSRCIVCFNEINNTHPYRKTESFNHRRNEASTRASIKHSEKWKARTELRRAVKIGLIKKLKFCQVCEKIKPLQGHHPNYAKPLEVLWLCSRCHADVHRKVKIKLNNTPKHLQEVIK
jgi:hypothetical protein